MEAQLRAALDSVEEAAHFLFFDDPSTRSVGVGLMDREPVFIAARNVNALEARMPAPRERRPTLGRIPVRYEDCTDDPVSFSAVPAPVPEQLQQRPLVCGLEIQNFDDKLQTIGTLGCFVWSEWDRICLLSNFHVLGGVQGERIVQPSGSSNALVATVLASKGPVVSPTGTTYAQGSKTPNTIDAALAELVDPHNWSQAYLPARVLAPPATSGPVTYGKVHKVGRSTQGTTGMVTQIGVVVRTNYPSGICWFHDAVIVEGQGGMPFSGGGDSGAAVVRDDGTMIGLVYGGRPATALRSAQTLVCPMVDIETQLKCRLA